MVRNPYDRHLAVDSVLGLVTSVVSECCEIIALLIGIRGQYAIERRALRNSTVIVTNYIRNGTSTFSDSVVI